MDRVLTHRIAMLAAGMILLPSFSCDGKDRCISDEVANCCGEFHVAQPIYPDIGGGERGQALARTISDFVVAGDTMVSDLTSACRRIAQDLGAPSTDQAAAESSHETRERLKAWCALAKTQIDARLNHTTAMVSGTAVCELSVGAMVACQARCSAGGTCDVEANPPSCEGGRLEVACHGDCVAVDAALRCSGHCSGACDGVCEAVDGVACSGRCEGVCEASAGSPGIQDDGTCRGLCKGTCSATAPGASCDGRCAGQCGGTCTGTPETPVKCDGDCKADRVFLTCMDGELAGGCRGTPCDWSCDASARAKAVCQASPVTVAFSASNNETLDELGATLEANLGVVMVVDRRARMLLDWTTPLSDELPATPDLKAACIPPMAWAIGNATEDILACAKVIGPVLSGVGHQP